jgi:cytochrome oxidase Cu insertion factor (SCO1/SenC/PrrC family)
MRLIWRWTPATLAVLLVACQVASAKLPALPGATSATVQRELRVGDVAPDFTLMDQNRQNITLSQLRGRPVQVAFYVWAFSSG